MHLRMEIMESRWVKGTVNHGSKDGRHKEGPPCTHAKPRALMKLLWGSRKFLPWLLFHPGNTLMQLSWEAGAETHRPSAPAEG